MIRPETIRVVEAGSAPLSGVIDSVSFIGDRQRLLVSGQRRGAKARHADGRVEVGVEVKGVSRCAELAFVLVHDKAP